MKRALILVMTLFLCFSATAQQKPFLNVRGFRLGMQVEDVCEHLRKISAHIESLSSVTGQRSSVCVEFQDGVIDGDQNISIVIVDRELASVKSRFPNADYDRMYAEAVKRLGKPTRSVVAQFSGPQGTYGKQRRAEWLYTGTVSLTLADGSAAKGNRVGPGFLLLQNDERIYASLN